MLLNRKRKNGNSGYVLFDVVYKDGALSSNRKVPATALDNGNLDGGDRSMAAKAFLENQDRQIARATGTDRGAIESIVPSDR